MLGCRMVDFYPCRPLSCIFCIGLYGVVWGDPRGRTKRIPVHDLHKEAKLCVSCQHLFEKLVKITDYLKTFRKS